jgi:hypothetical protein
VLFPVTLREEEEDPPRGSREESRAGDRFTWHPAATFIFLPQILDLLFDADPVPDPSTLKPGLVYY